MCPATVKQSLFSELAKQPMGTGPRQGEIFQFLVGAYKHFNFQFLYVVILNEPEKILLTLTYEVRDFQQYLKVTQKT